MDVGMNEPRTDRRQVARRPPGEDPKGTAESVKSRGSQVAAGLPTALAGLGLGGSVAVPVVVVLAIVVVMILVFLIWVISDDVRTARLSRLLRADRREDQP
jgi:hypothetical protein